MKISSIFRVSFLGLAVFLSACGSGSTLGDSLTREYNTTNGEFKSLGSVKVNDLVTHLFEEEDGTILYAYSTRYDLNENLNTRVEAYGVITTYENLDKPLFEVKRINAATEEVTTTETVTTVDYKNAGLGITFSYPSNWTVSTEDSTRTILDAPLPVTDETAVSSGTDVAPDASTTALTEALPQADEAEFVKLPAGLTLTSSDDQDARATEIRSYASSHFPDLAGVTGDLTYVGTDRVVGVRYKLDGGDVYIFVPRSTDLFELHFHYLASDDTVRIDDTNTFTGMVAGFRFIPASGETSSTEPTTPATPTTPVTTTPTPSVTQSTVSKWTSLSSNAFEFTMSVPAAWYYVGGSTGYVFDLQAIEDVNATGVVKLAFNSTTTEGRSSSGDSVSLTKKVESRYYTLTGLAEYETIMKTMLDSIKTTKAE